ncbi:MAG: hypothetical protein AB1810_14130 [Pseudomonadota bacterium]
MKMAKILLMLFAVFAVGCSSQPSQVHNPHRSIDGVLIVAGEGLNSTYEDIRMNNSLFLYSQKVAESLGEEIVKTQTQAQYFINIDKSLKIVNIVGEILSKNKRDGLAQVSIDHVKNDKENNIYLAIVYNPLLFQKDGSVTVGEAYSERYLLHEYSSASVLARDFAQKLLSRGYIGKK